MNLTTLPTSVEIDGKVLEFNSDYRVILKMFKAFTDPNLTKPEKLIVGLNLFYKTDDCNGCMDEAIIEMLKFVTMSDDTEQSQSSVNSKPLYDWEKDFNIIIAPINKILGYDVRGKEYLHWWTFLSAFMEIGECTFSTYVSIRDKLQHGKKLEKYEQKILKEHREDIILKEKVDDTTQAMLDEIMGV